MGLGGFKPTHFKKKARFSEEFFWGVGVGGSGLERKSMTTNKHLRDDIIGTSIINLVAITVETRSSIASAISLLIVASQSTPN